MNAIEYVDELWSLFSNNEELCDLLKIRNDEDYAVKIREEDVMAEGYEPEGLPFIAMYFAEAWTTDNDFMNRGYLYIDIYATMRDEIIPIRKIIVDTIHKQYDLRIRNEMQTPSGVHAVYKYRLVFNPLIFT